MSTLPAPPPTAADSFGAHLRHWRQHRRLSQLDLAHEAQVSTRHLSYVETGRAEPSREMVLRLAERLEVPLRERNALLVAAGYAPMYRQRSLDDPALAPARQAVELVLKGHEPFPALAVDRHWNLVAHNALVPLLMAGAAPRTAEAAGQRAAAQPAPARAWRRASPTWRNGARTCSNGCSSRSPPPATRRWPRCTTSSRPTRRRSVSHDTPAGGGELAGVVVPFQFVTPQRRAELHQHHDHLRHAGRRHAAGAGGGVVLSGGRADGGGADVKCGEKKPA